MKQFEDAELETTLDYIFVKALIFVVSRVFNPCYFSLKVLTTSWRGYELLKQTRLIPVY